MGNFTPISINWDVGCDYIFGLEYSLLEVSQLSMKSVNGVYNVALSTVGMHGRDVKFLPTKETHITSYKYKAGRGP